MQRSPSDNGCAGYYTHSPYQQVNNASFGSARQSSQQGSFHPPYNSFGSQNEGLGGISNSPQDRRRLSAGPYYVGSDNTASTQYTQNMHSFRSTPMVMRACFDDGDADHQANGMSVSSNTSSARARKRRVSNKNLLSVSSHKEATSQSGDSSASSVLDNLPLCTADSNCTLINDKAHQYKFAHTCRLFPCYHGHIKRHAKLFRHAPNQIASTSNGEKSSPLSLASVTFAFISPDAPNATKVTVSSQDVAYDIYGDWSQVKVHTFKRYLHQVFGVEPKEQILSMGSKLPMDDDLEIVQFYINRVPNTGIMLTSGGSSVSERERQKMREALVDEL